MRVRSKKSFNLLILMFTTKQSSHSRHKKSPNHTVVQLAAESECGLTVCFKLEETKCISSFAGSAYERNVNFSRKKRQPSELKDQLLKAPTPSLAIELLARKKMAQLR